MASEKRNNIKKGQNKDICPLEETYFQYKNISSGKANRHTGIGMIHRITNTQYKWCEKEKEKVKHKWTLYTKPINHKSNNYIHIYKSWQYAYMRHVCKWTFSHENGMFVFVHTCLSVCEFVVDNPVLVLCYVCGHQRTTLRTLFSIHSSWDRLLLNCWVCQASLNGSFQEFSYLILPSQTKIQISFRFWIV